MNKKVIAVALALVLAGGGYAQNDASGKKVKAYMVSDAHLDTQWNWDIQTTINELCMEYHQSELISAKEISGIHFQL